MRATPPFALACLLLAACGDDPAGSPSDSSKAGSGGSAQLREVPCQDESVSALSLFDKPSQGRIIDDLHQGDTFESVIDATGGGLTPSESFVYARFTDSGLKRVDLSDEQAFRSLDWDLAFRRYIIRLNSGVSGPGDVTGARTRPNTDFDALRELPEELEFRTEEYFTDSCAFVNDTSGLEGGPGTALSSFWSYPGCVSMTHNVYVVEVTQPKKRHVKLTVQAYYSLKAQRSCDSTGTVPSPSGAGNLRVRWAFLD
jgi:hypothetical protein